VKLGRWDEAERAVARADHIGPLGMNEILTRELQGRLAMLRGRFDEASERLRPLGPWAERTADIQFIVPVQASLAELALWQGRASAAAAQVATAIPLVDHTGEVRIGELFALGVRANADVAELGRVRRADADVASAIAAGERLLTAMVRRHGAVVAQRTVFEPTSLAWVLLCEAEASRLHRAPDPDAWVRAAEAWDRLGRPYLAAYARWRETEARLAARGDRETAITALRGARDVAERLRAEPMLREIGALAVRARFDLGPSGSAAPPEAASADTDEAARLGLTAREREVLELVAAGRTNRQIGETLFISENTAGVHVSNILGKLGVAGRGEAAAIAYRLGLVDPSVSAPDLAIVV
jgi:DNA-binding CsgD family transcriptional regulator